MTKLTMRTLILAALLATPACAADVDALADSPPQPAPPVSQTVQDRTILADALVEVTAQYQTMLSEAGNRADEMHASYRGMIMALLTFAAIVVGVFPVLQHRQFQRLAGQLDTQRKALAAQKTAGDRAMTALLQKTAAIYSNMAFAYLSSRDCQLQYGLVYVSNAVFTHNEAGSSANCVMGPMDWWLQAAKRSTTLRIPPDQVPVGDLRASWSSLVEVGDHRNAPLFSRKLQTIRETFGKMLEGNEEALEQIFGAPISPDAPPGPATAPPGTSDDVN